MARAVATLSPTLSALRLPALVFATASVLVVAGLTREVGGGTWLVVRLVLALVGGLLLVGPRQILLARAILAGAALAVRVALPDLAWQFRHGLPQLATGRALSAQNAGDVRVSALPILLVMVAPIAVPTWIAGFVARHRRAAWSGSWPRPGS